MMSVDYQQTVLNIMKFIGVVSFSVVCTSWRWLCHVKTCCSEV